MSGLVSARLVIIWATQSAHIVQSRCQSATRSIHMHIWDKDLVDSEIDLSTRNGKDRGFQVKKQELLKRLHDRHVECAED